MTNVYECFNLFNFLSSKSVRSLLYQRLKPTQSIFAAELTAIVLCLTSLRNTSPLPSTTLLFTDSFGSLLSIQNLYTLNSIVQRIHLLYHSFSKNGGPSPSSGFSDTSGFKATNWWMSQPKPNPPDCPSPSVALKSHVKCLLRNMILAQ